MPSNDSTRVEITRAGSHRLSCFLLTLILCCSELCSVHAIRSTPSGEKEFSTGKRVPAFNDDAPISKNLPSNHRMESEIIEPHLYDEQSHSRNDLTNRRGRQYEGSLGASGSGNYASVSGDGAYVAQLPISASVAGSTAAISPVSNYPVDPSNGYHDILGQLLAARSYHPGGHLGSPTYYHPAVGPTSANFGTPMSPLASMLSLIPFSSGIGTSSLAPNPILPLIGKGFDVSEVVCTAIAVAIGAVIVGAPFILIYLFFMNQMGGGNGPTGGPSSSTISLTGPSSSTNVSGRKKRNATEAFLRQLSPLVNGEQVSNTFNMLMSSMSKYHS